MSAIIYCLTTIISTASFLALWFWLVHRELAAKTDTVNSAASQLTACRKKHIQTRGRSEEQAVKSIFSRSQDIYRQSVILYNQTLLKPWNYIPGLLMGFRQMKEGKDSFCL